MTNGRASVRASSGWWIGILLAIALLVGSGAGYRAAAARLGRAPTAIPLARGTLQKLPLHLDGWIGRDVPLGEAVIKSTDTDDHINRTYSRVGGQGGVSLFVGYGVRMRDLMPHRPEVCYPGAGWTLDDTRQVDLAAVDGSIVPCQIHRFHRGGLDPRRIEVLNYYMVDGRYCADVSLLRSESWRLDSRMSYAAQVQIAGGTGPRGSTESTVSEFAADFAPAIRRLLIDAVEEVSHGDQ